ncbi:hypothetical protein OWV82_020121 [Melia azedarach]|uniref:Uncharacterized protein n=1 Tax=Melia azedarach TaxID=155640 RepID=A0ACC1X5L5_MELAZ|nr:hypothetical protein OWV82_020121 [Melia azedarach]
MHINMAFAKPTAIYRMHNLLLVSSFRNCMKIKAVSCLQNKKSCLQANDGGRAHSINCNLSFYFLSLLIFWQCFMQISIKLEFMIMFL